MPTKEEILNNQKHGFNSGQYESAIKAMEEYANQEKAKLLEEIEMLKAEVASLTNRLGER